MERNDMSERYVFTMYLADGTLLSLEGNKITIDEMIEDFKTFLLGCTFSSELVHNIWREQEPEGHNGN